jgi:hypothetical protein
MRNILIGGKMGDFIHSLILPKYVFDKTGERFNIYITDHAKEIFASGLETSYNELFPIIIEQNYVNNFEIWNNQHIDINLTTFRDFENLFTTSWNEFYLWNYIGSYIDVPFNYSWIDLKKDKMYEDVLLVNRNYHPYSGPDVEDYYLNYLKGFNGKAYFICSYIDQYTTSPLNGLLPMIYLPSMKDMMIAISSCKHFLGNLTATAAMATALNIPRTIEMHNPNLRYKYIYEMKNYNNLSCFG